jgi:hypothetical protein
VNGRQRVKSLGAQMREVGRRSPATAEHEVDDDCPLCRMVAGRAPIETIELPDGSILTVHELPTTARKRPG